MKNDEKPTNEKRMKTRPKSSCRGLLGSNDVPIEVRPRSGENAKRALERRLATMCIYGD